MLLHEEVQVNNYCKERLFREGTPFFATAKRNYKDTLFRMVFKEPKELLQLYNAVNGTQYTNPDDLEIVTLENAIYMSMKNDLAFIVGCHLNMYEQQSTFNPNMPLRFLQYVSREYEKLIVDKTIYSSKLVKLPTPEFIVFYNGSETMPERMVMKLSESFEVLTETPALELQVIQLNINDGCNRKLMEQLLTMSREHPQIRLIAQDQYSACFSVPKSCISIRKPYSEERRARDSERAKAAGISPPRT